MSRDNIFSLPSIRATIPPGGIAQIGPIPGEIATSIKLISGGTLEIGGYSLTISSGASSGLQSLVAGSTVTYAAGQTFGQMYPISSNEVFSANCSGAVYLYASGATCVVAIGLGRSAFE